MKFDWYHFMRDVVPVVLTGMFFGLVVLLVVIPIMAALR